MDWLKQMNDDVILAKAAGDTARMLDIAAEYERRGMHQTASRIRLEVNILPKWSYDDSEDIPPNNEGDK